MVQQFNFTALSQTPDSAAEESEDRKLYDMEISAENQGDNPAGQPDATPSASAAADVAPDAPDVVKEGGDSTPAVEGDEKKPDEPADEDSDEEKERKANEAGSLNSLMLLAAGKLGSDQVKINVAQPVVSTSAFESLSASRRLDPESEQELDNLVSSLSSEAEQAIQAPKTSRAAVTEKSAAAQPVHQQQQMMAQAPLNASAQIGDMAGRAIAGVAAFPFIALSSAARHLVNRFQAPGVTPPAPASVAASLQASKGGGIPLSMANTLETITDWKCERIEKAGEAVKKAADRLMGTEDFVTWEDEVSNVAGQRGITPFDVVREMHSNPDYAPLKEKMDRLWSNHPGNVDAYRAACDDFERNIRNVVKEFPNSEDEVKDRVANTMKQVEDKTQTLPGFGDTVGEYTKALAERVRELAQMIAEFVTELMRRIGGKTRGSDLSM